MSDWIGGGDSEGRAKEGTQVLSWITGYIKLNLNKNIGEIPAVKRAELESLVWVMLV